jgi:hypothetical protein
MTITRGAWWRPGADDTVLTDVFVLNWPKGAAVRVLGNSVTAGLDGRLMGHDPATLPREVIAHDSGQPLLRYSTDSPMRHTTGRWRRWRFMPGRASAPSATWCRRRTVCTGSCRRRASLSGGRGCHDLRPRNPGRYASPPCMAAEVDPAYFDPLPVDPEQARDVARWRRAERVRLRAERDACPWPTAGGRGGDRRPSGRPAAAKVRHAAGAGVLGLLADQGRAGPAPAAGGAARRRSVWSPCRWSR